MASTEKDPKDGPSDSSTPVTPAATEAPNKRHKTVRTTIRRLLEKATQQAIGRLGDTTTGANKRAVGSTSMEIETRVKGKGPTVTVKKHVRVEVLMAVSDNDVCGSTPPAPPVPPVTPPSKPTQKWSWWVAWPIIGLAIFTSTPQDQQPLPAQPPVVTTTPVATKPVPPAPVGPVIPAPDVPKPAPPAVNPTEAGGGDLPGTSDGPLPAPAGSPPPFIGCNGLTGQLATAPDYTETRTPDWVKSRAVTWFVKRLPQCGATVQAFDTYGNTINQQDYGVNMAFLGQRVYVYGRAQIQIDMYNSLNRFVGRTTYLYTGSQTQRVSLAYRLDPQGNRLFEALINRDSDGSISSLTLWTFGADEKVCSQATYINTGQITANLNRYFFQFPDFESGSW